MNITVIINVLKRFGIIQIIISAHHVLLLVIIVFLIMKKLVFHVFLDYFYLKNSVLLVINVHWVLMHEDLQIESALFVIQLVSFVQVKVICYVHHVNKDIS